MANSKPKVIGKNTARQASVAEFPISKGMTGVSMGMAPGGMRELHWHATAAEWAFVDKGRVRTTVLSPGGFTETNEFEPGDVWYFPRGHGHMLECLGDEPCHFMLIFDNGYQSEFGTFSISDWIGHSSKALLAKNFGLPESTFDGFPKDEVYFAQGTPPPAQAAPPLAGPKPGPRTHKWRLLADVPHVDNKGGRLWIVDSSKFPIAKTVTGAILELEPGALAGTALAPVGRRVGLRLRGPGQRDDVRAPRGVTGRRRLRRATSATSRRATATRSRTSGTRSVAS